jgi:flagellar hook-basal body complex protein FliE
MKSANAHDVSSMVGATTFGDFLKESSRKAVATLRQNEKVSMQSASGTNDLILTMTAADNAEITLQTIMAVRDRTVQAYQEISRMPI